MVRQTINYVMMLLSILMIGETFHYSSEDKIFVYAEALAPSGIVTYLPQSALSLLPAAPIPSLCDPADFIECFS